MITIVVATGNDHKLREIREILNPQDIKVLGAREVGGLPDVVEDGTTFVENASKKAVEIAEYCGQPTLADDSGLEVLALGNEPGVYSARYAGSSASDQNNLNLLLENMAGVEDRRARFRCVIALASVSGDIRTAEGEINGVIAENPRGDNGFGYDPVFIPNGYSETFAELPAEVKNKLSHRGAALQNAIAKKLFEGVHTGWTYS